MKQPNLQYFLFYCLQLIRKAHLKNEWNLHWFHSLFHFLKCLSHIVFFNLSATPLYLILFDWVTHAVVEISIWGDNRIFTETSIKQWVKISSFMRAVKNKNSFIECSGNNFNALHITLPFKSFSGQGDLCLRFWI